MTTASRRSSSDARRRATPLAVAAALLLVSAEAASAAFVDDVLEGLRDWQLAEALRTSFYGYPIVNALHIFGLGLLVGSIVLVDLRLVGFFPRTPTTFFGRIVEPAAIIGLVIAAVTGFFLFIVKPTDYAVNDAFRVKLVLVVLALLNALFQRFGSGWRLAMVEGTIVARVRVQAAVSLVLWIAILFAGRFIAFLE